MAGFPSSGATHPQSSDGGGGSGSGVDVESADRPPATSCHVGLDIPEPVHKSEDRAVAMVEDDPCCVTTMFKGLYFLAIIFASYAFIRIMATTKMTWQEALEAVLLAGVGVCVFLVIALAYSSDKQEWEVELQRSKT